MDPEPGEPTEGNAAELLERVIRDTAALGSAVATRDAGAIRRTAMDLAAVGALAVALLAGFVLANVAALDALHSPLPGWRAPLVVALGWLVVGALAAIRLRRLRALRSGSGRSVDDAEARLRATLEELTALVTAHAERRIVSALLPISGQLARTGEDVMDAADEVIEAADEITDVIERTLPGGIIVNRAADLALAPSRFGVRVVRRAFNLRIETTTNGPPPP
jgi:uncharacterized integral membrane protein